LVDPKLDLSLDTRVDPNPGLIEREKEGRRAQPENDETL
jgi:hypothetical protein